MSSAGGVREAVATGVLTAVAAAEDAVDEELQRMDDVGQSELDRLREERIRQMKQHAKQVCPSIIKSLPARALVVCVHFPGTARGLRLSRALVPFNRRPLQREELKTRGRGQYTEITEEREFFEECKKNEKVVCHFFRSSTWRCEIVDKHLALLAPRHLETRFIKLSVERAPFLCQRLHIQILPSIGIVVDGKTKDFIKGMFHLIKSRVRFYLNFLYTIVP